MHVFLLDKNGKSHSMGDHPLAPESFNDIIDSLNKYGADFCDVETDSASVSFEGSFIVSDKFGVYFEIRAKPIVADATVYQFSTYWNGPAESPTADGEGSAH